MSDEEVEAFLAAHEDEPEQDAHGGEYGVALACSGALGGFASAQLLLAELHLARHPDEALTCDVTATFGCSTFLNAWQGHLLGVPNALLGLAFFSGLLALGLVYILGSRPRIEPLLGVGAACGTVALIWFAYQSVNAGVLCPWCLAAWIATVPYIGLTAARLAPPLRAKRWWLVAGGYLLTAIIAALIILG